MIGKLVNLPFKVLGGVARAVQNQEAKKWANLAEQDAESAKSLPNMDISVPSDFDPGPLQIEATVAVQVLQQGCVVDTHNEAIIPGALHIPLADVGIRIAELPPDTKIVVVAPNPDDADNVVTFLRHRGLDDTWSVSGGMKSWTQAFGATGASTK